MRRRRPPATPPKLIPIEAGCCLLALDIMRRHGLACPSDAEVLSLIGVSEAADDFEDCRYALMSQVLDRLIDGLLAQRPVGTSRT